MPWEFRREIQRKFLSSSTRTGEQRVASGIQRRYRLFPRDGWKLAEEFMEGLAALQIIEEALDGHSGPHEDGRSAEDLWIAVHDGIWAHLWGSVRVVPEYTPIFGRVSNAIGVGCAVHAAEVKHRVIPHQLHASARRRRGGVHAEFGTSSSPHRPHRTRFSPAYTARVSRFSGGAKAQVE